MKWRSCSRQSPGRENQRQVMSDLVDEEAEHFKKKGLLGLQLHVGPPMKIEFKDILLKRLPLTD